MKKGLKRTLTVLVIVLVILLVIAALPFCAPLHYAYTAAEAEADNNLIGEFLDIVADASTDEDDNIPEIIQVSIPPDTVNAMLRAAACIVSRDLKDKGVLCALEWDGGSSTLRAAGSYDGPKLPMAVTVRAEFVSPSIRDGSVFAPATGLRAGLLPLPNSLIPGKISANDIKNDNLKQALAAIHHLSAAPDGSLDVGIYPERLSNLTRLLAGQRKDKGQPQDPKPGPDGTPGPDAAP